MLDNLYFFIKSTTVTICGIEKKKKNHHDSKHKYKILVKRQGPHHLTEINEI